MTDSNPYGFRIAIRTEGKFINCYLQPDVGIKSDMGPILMGSMLVNICLRCPDHFRRWKELMQEVIAQACIELFGERPTFTEQAGPESERAGNA